MLEPLSSSDVRAAGDLLARAFRDNPGILSVLKDDPPEVRLRLLQASMSSFAAAARRYGVAEVVRDEGRLVAVSLSFPPGKFPLPILGQLMVARGPLLAGLARTLRFARLDYEMRKRHPEYIHWYLWILGVEPECQGKGHGSALLRSLSARANGLACYLETDKASSVRIYEKHGYRVVSEELLRSLGLRLWFMKRDERVAASGPPA